VRDFVKGLGKVHHNDISLYFIVVVLASSCINDISCVSHDLEERKPCCRS
jgi:hypothetical protein